MTTPPETFDAPPAREQPTDLGFGSVVASESRQRLLNRDGSFNVERHGLSLLESLSIYHDLMTMPWSIFLGMVIVAYLVINSLFAMAFIACGPDALSGIHATTQSERIADAFFFSVDTLATIGYGNIAPVSFAANVLVTIESLVGLLGIALIAGVIFAKFSRPVARVLFSEKALIAPYHGSTAFMFRIANSKKNQIVELQAKVLMIRWINGAKGRTREFIPLALERDRVTFFPLTWTIVHPIDKESPLWNVGPEDLLLMDAEFLILLSGVDETFAQVVHARSSYRADEIVFGAKFRSVFNDVDRRGIISANLRDIHDYEVVS